MFLSPHEIEIYRLPDEEKAKKIFELEERVEKLQLQKKALEDRKKDNEFGIQAMFILIWIAVFIVAFGTHKMSQYIDQVGFSLLVVWTFGCSASLVHIAKQRLKLNFHFGIGVAAAIILTVTLVFLIKTIVEM